MQSKSWINEVIKYINSLFTPISEIPEQEMLSSATSDSMINGSDKSTVIIGGIVNINRD